MFAIDLEVVHSVHCMSWDDAAFHTATQFVGCDGEMPARYVCRVALFSCYGRGSTLKPTSYDEQSAFPEAVLILTASSEPKLHFA